MVLNFCLLSGKRALDDGREEAVASIMIEDVGQILWVLEIDV